MDESMNDDVRNDSDISITIEDQSATEVQIPPDSNEESKKVRSTPAAQINGFGTQEPLIGGGSPIFRVPAHVRGVEMGAYTPKIVRIGPFYQNDQPNLRAFESQKKRFLARLQTRMNFKVLENAMKEMEEKTRKWYVEDFEGMKSDDFVQMMLRDGCFIVELLRLYTMKTSQVHA